MAFTRQVSHPGGREFPAAYHVVSDVRVDWLRKRASVTVKAYKDAAARAANGAVVKVLHYQLDGAGFTAVLGAAANDPAGANYVRQLYLYVKAQLADPAIVDV